MANDLVKFLKSPAGIGVIFIALVVMNVGGLGDTVKGFFAPTSGGSTGGSDLPCLHDGATMTIGPMEIMWDPTATVPAHYAKVYVNGVDYGYKSDGASMEVSPGDNIEIFYGENASTAAPTVLPFVYTARQEFSVPCKSDFTTGDPTLDNEAYKLYNTTNEDHTVNLSTNVLCLSHDDGTENTGTAPEDIEWGDNYNVDCRLTGIHRKAFSPYAKPAMCVEYNESSWDLVEVLDGNGNVYPSVAKPSSLSLQETVYTMRCYEFSSIMSSNQYDFKLHLDVADTGTAYTAPHYDNNISVFLIDQDWFENTLTGEMEMGYEDNVGTQLGAEDQNYIYEYAIAGPD